MAAISTTGTLTAGSSKTFNLAPGSALSLTLSPNVRVTITETPETVSGSGVGGNTTRVHEPQLPGTFAYGPYAMGGVVVVAVASNSGSSVTWTRKDTVVTTNSDGTSLVSGDGTVIEIGGGGGSSTFAGLSDKTSADIPATNTPTATALGLKAPLASPTFTGTPSAPTAAPGTNTTQLATTEFVLANAGGGSPVLGPYATEAALETAYPAASNSEAFATVGASAPYKLYWSDGNSWILSTARANPLVTIASSGASFTQSAINTSVVDVTLTGNCTIAFSNVPAGAYTVRLILRQDATGSRTVTWPGSVSWDGSGSAPALRSTPGAIDDIELTTVDSGATWIARNLRAQQAANPASYGLTHIRNDGTTTQTLTGSANTKLAAALTTVVSNADGWWDTTNKKFVPTVVGKYLITVGVQTDAASIQAVAQVYKNGAPQGNGNGYGASAYCASQNTQVVTMNGTTDYVEAYVFHSGTAATNNAVDNTYFKALFLGA